MLKCFGESVSCRCKNIRLLVGGDDTGEEITLLHFEEERSGVKVKEESPSLGKVKEPDGGAKIWRLCFAAKVFPFDVLSIIICDILRFEFARFMDLMAVVEFVALFSNDFPPRL